MVTRSLYLTGDYGHYRFLIIAAREVERNQGASDVEETRRRNNYAPRENLDKNARVPVTRYVEERRYPVKA